MTTTTMARQKQGILVGGVWTLAGRSIAAGGAIVMHGLIARIVPAEAFGAYVLASSLTLFVSILACAGLHRGAVRLIASFLAKSRTGEAAWMVYLTVIVGLVLSSGLGLLIFVLLGDWLATTVFDAPLLAGVSILLLFWLILRTLQALLPAIFRGTKDLRSAAVIDGALPTVLIIAGLIGYSLVAVDQTFTGVMSVIVIATTASILLGFVFLVPTVRSLGKPVSVPGTEVANTALPLFVAAMALIGIGEAHVLLLGMLRPEEDVALYGAAQRLVKFVSFPLLIVNSILPPFVASEFAKGRKGRLQDLLQSAATLCGLPSLLILLALIFFTKPVMSLIFGPFYAAGSTALIILSIGHALNVATGSPGILLAMSDRQGQLMWIATATGLLGLLISFLLIPRIGLLGAAVGASMGISLNNIVMWAYARARLDIKTEMSLSSLPLIYNNLRGRIAGRSDSSKT
ncbi:MAG: oligosaccharide flippase family protein [Gammaproteobacteria bacterium]|nr:oligosaccharide flippase family protein [Gammaproteobacteria bacterium]